MTNPSIPVVFKTSPTGRVGKIFEVGSWEDKSFSMTPQELERAARIFAPVPIDLDHISTILDGKLGSLETVWVESGTMFGKAVFPEWLESLLQGEEVKVSATWDREEKVLKGLALTRTPRIDDAVLLAAFKKESTRMSDDQMNTNDPPPFTSWAAFAKFCETMGRGFVGFGLTSTTETTIKTEEPKDDKEEEESTKDPEIESLKAQLRELQESKLRGEMSSFTDQLIRDHRLLPAEREITIESLMVDALDDLNNASKVTFSTTNPDGKISEKSGTRVEFRKHQLSLRPKVGIFEDSVVSGQSLEVLFSSSKDSSEKSMSIEDRNKLLSSSVLGRAILDELKAKETSDKAKA